MIAAKKLLLAARSTLVKVKGFSSLANPPNASIPLPTHAAGDLIFIMATDRRQTPPALPSGYTGIDTAFVNAGASQQFSMRIGYKFAVSSSELSGEWTGASDISVLIASGVRAIGNLAKRQNQVVNAQPVFPALTLASARSVVVGAARADLSADPADMRRAGYGIAYSIKQRPVFPQTNTSSGNSADMSFSVELVSK